MTTTITATTSRTTTTSTADGSTSPGPVGEHADHTLEGAPLAYENTAVRAVGWATALVLVTAPSGAMGQGLDVRGWLDRPGVKLLAVEFYATWCKPCIAAVPKWKALHERYRAEGLRLVVVATQDPEGACANPGWNPDDVICDNDGRIARALGANKLPSAYLWSWQGDLLVRRGHVEEVDRAIRQWARHTPRVDVEVTSLPEELDLSKAGLRVLLRGELHRSGKLTVVATREEQEKLDRIRAESLKGRYDDALQCEIGEDVSANSLLTARVTSGRRPQLQLTLLSAERGCLVATAMVEWQPQRARVATAEAVAELLQKLRPQVKMPGTSSVQRRPTTAADQDLSEQPTAWQPEQGVEDVIVRFESDPVGAVVMVDGQLLCQSTKGGCSKAISVGRHEVAMLLERYEKRGEVVTIESGDSKIAWALQPTFAWLTVESEPKGQSISINGREVGKTPLRDHELAPGSYDVVLDERCFFKKGSRVTLSKGERKKLDFALAPRLGAIKVMAKDGEGNDVAADVVVDGEEVGRTPGTFEVSICSKELVVKHDEHGVWTGELSVVERQVKRISAALTGGSGMVQNADLPEQLSDAEIFRVLRKNKKDIRRCQSEQRSADPSVEGVMSVKFTILRNGRTDKHHVEPGRFQGTVLADCVITSLRKWRFPQFSGRPLRLDFPVRMGSRR